MIEWVLGFVLVWLVSLLCFACYCRGWGHGFDEGARRARWEGDTHEQE